MLITSDQMKEYIGIDLHKAFFQACLVSATGERPCAGRARERVGRALTGRVY